MALTVTILGGIELWAFFTCRWDDHACTLAALPFAISISDPLASKIVDVVARACESISNRARKSIDKNRQRGSDTAILPLHRNGR